MYMYLRRLKLGWDIELGTDNVPMIRLQYSRIKVGAGREERERKFCARMRMWIRENSEGARLALAGGSY